MLRRVLRGRNQTNRQDHATEYDWQIYFQDKPHIFSSSGKLVVIYLYRHTRYITTTAISPKHCPIQVNLKIHLQKLHTPAQYPEQSLLYTVHLLNPIPAFDTGYAHHSYNE